MRDQDRDLELPNFGPAEREPMMSPSNGQPSIASTQQPGVKSSGSNLLSYLIILLLATAVGGLAYWGYLQHQQLQALQADRINIDKKIVELQQLFLVAGNSAAQTGETLQSQVEKQAATTQQQFTQLNDDVAKTASEIAKLWVIAHQRNTPKIAELDTQLKGALSQLETQTKSLSDLNRHLLKLDKQLSVAADKDSDKQQQIVAIRQSSAALSTEFQILAESLERQQAEQGKSLAALAKQVSTLKSGQGSAAALERRVRVNEQAVKAIDGSRLQVNKELLHIRQKLNNLQLKIERL
ncbi:hypothetical protein Q4488_11940 [Amphritea sp. 1_MG-2023]|uniref:hypothetical protein n=1 Tax=Amphritea sp. 1_MG-2023 TaxID=3062670 RepID=UPI0026E2CACC|nr:hypothetical protein [Amphritea sp. 1_MG-2023]MDO6564095.1 hypothetical protein [Amphritea sp. 1_MG-2023]